MPLRFQSLELRNWRNFRQVSVELERRVFLVGPNASGKSNLLDVFVFLHDLVSVGGGFQEAVRKRGGVGSIRALSARQQPDVVVSVVIGDEGSGTRWDYELAFGPDPKTKMPILKRESVTKDSRLLLERPNRYDADDPARLTQTYLEQVNVNKDFREIAEFLTSIRYLHIVPQLVREPDRSVGRVDDPYGGDFLESVAGTHANVRRARLKRITEALKVAVPQLQELELTRDRRGAPHLEGRYEHWRPQGARQTEETFSDGTLRLLGLLWAVLDGNGPLLLEEPELSLHSGVVRYLPQLFARTQTKTKRQMMLSTHSPDLLQDAGIGLNEVLLLIPAVEGTTVQPASQFEDIPALLAGGLNLAEAILPRTSPRNAQQIGLFEAIG